MSGRGLAYGLTAMGRWIAVALADGKSDNVVYETRRDAVRHQHHNERNFAFMQLQPFQLSICQAESFLYMHRLCYEAGGLLSDPEGSGHELIPALTTEEFNDQLLALRQKSWIRTVTYDDPRNRRNWN